LATPQKIKGEYQNKERGKIGRKKRSKRGRLAGTGKMVQLWGTSKGKKTGKGRRG